MDSSPDEASSGLTAAAYAAFAAFGAFWGIWGASIPRIQAQAGLTPGQLGFALLFVGVGALPSMLLIGKALDRWGPKVGAAAITTLGIAGAGAIQAGRSLPSLCVGLSAVGAASGATDVAMNAIAGRAAKLTGGAVIARAHGLFSAMVVAFSLAAGGISAASLPPVAAFLAVMALCIITSLYMLRALPPFTSPARLPAAPATGRPVKGPQVVPLVLIGTLGALAFASENAHQSWAAVYAYKELHASASLAAIAPALFAASVAIARLLLAILAPAQARVILLAGAMASATGAAVIATASSLLVAGLGLVVAGVGTAVLFPTLLTLVSNHVDESQRGQATSIVTTVSYLGFHLGPVYVGLCADVAGLRAAMLAVAALALALFAVAPALLRLSGFHAADQRGIKNVARAESSEKSRLHPSYRRRCHGAHSSLAGGSPLIDSEGSDWNLHASTGQGVCTVGRSPGTSEPGGEGVCR